MKTVLLLSLFLTTTAFAEAGVTVHLGGISKHTLGSETYKVGGKVQRTVYFVHCTNTAKNTAKRVKLTYNALHCDLSHFGAIVALSLANALESSV